MNQEDRFRAIFKNLARETREERERVHGRPCLNSECASRRTQCNPPSNVIPIHPPDRNQKRRPQ